MASIQRRVWCILAVALVCAWVTAQVIYPRRAALREVAAYAPDVAQGIVYDDWLVETHGGFQGDGTTLIRFDVTDPSVFDGFSPPPFDYTVTQDDKNGFVTYSIVPFSTSSAMPDPETAYWMLDVHGPDSMPWNNLCVGLYYPETQEFYWYESDI